jgi:hypothetical protein
MSTCPPRPAAEILSVPRTWLPLWIVAILIELRRLPASGEGVGLAGVPVCVVVEPPVVGIGIGIGMFIGIVVVAGLVLVLVVEPPPPGCVWVPVVVVVVVASPPTTIVPVMNVCLSQWNAYVPGVLNVQLPDQPGAVAAAGIGGAWSAPLTVQEVGCGPLPKSTLCSLLPVGYEKFTVPPVAMFTVVLPSPAVNAKSLTVNEPVIGGVGAALALRIGSVAINAPTTPASPISRNLRFICPPS